MKRIASVLLLGAAAPCLNGCVALVAPVLAASTLTRGELKKRKNAQRKVLAAMPNAAARPDAAAIVADTAPLPVVPLVVPSAPVAVEPIPVAPDGMPLAAKYDAASPAQSNQGWAALAAYLNKAAALYRDKQSQRQMVMVDGSSLTAPYFEPCGAKPLAVIVDVDETTRSDLGLEAVGGADDGWQSWEVNGTAKVAAAPGAVAALAAARGAGIDVIFNTNRASAQAADTVAALNEAGVGPVEHYKSLWMRGDDGGGAEKDNRRWAIASGYCVIALVGDELGDFSDAFTTAGTAARRRTLATAPVLASLWGNGWFLIPNAVHGVEPAK